MPDRWWRRGLTAAALAADRPELWLPGALVSLLFAGWLPFVLVVVPLPGPGDLPFMAAAVRGSPLFPWNVALGLAGLAMLLLVGYLLAAAAEALLLARTPGRPATQRSAVGALPGMVAVLMAASLPAAAAAGLLALRVLSVAPAVFQSPDVGGGPILRTLLAVAPFGALLGAALFVSQLIGAPALRRLATPAKRRPPSALRALRGAVSDLWRRPVQLAATAALTLLVHVAYLAVVFVLLTVLWRPIAAELSGGLTFDLVVPALLVGFVAIWICLVLGAGALHAWASAWWSFELAAGRPPEREVIASAQT